MTGSGVDGTGVAGVGVAGTGVSGVGAGVGVVDGEGFAVASGAWGAGVVDVALGDGVDWAPSINGSSKTVTSGWLMAKVPGTPSAEA